jgi:hypothetical protein
MFEGIEANAGFAAFGFGPGASLSVSSMEHVAKNSLVLETVIPRERLWAGPARDR